MTPPKGCDYCKRPFSDPRGCLYEPADERPATYGFEAHPLSSGPTCRDCGAPKGTEHHAECLAAECRSCQRQWHAGLSCEEDARLVMGGDAA